MDFTLNGVTDVERSSNEGKEPTSGAGAYAQGYDGRLLISGIIVMIRAL